MKRDDADTVQLSKIRMKETLRVALERDAKAQGITLNAAIVSRLERSFRDDRDDRLEARLDEILACVQPVRKVA